MRYYLHRQLTSQKLHMKLFPLFKNILIKNTHLIICWTAMNLAVLKWKERNNKKWVIILHRNPGVNNYFNLNNWKMICSLEQNRMFTLGNSSRSIVIASNVNWFKLWHCIFDPGHSPPLAQGHTFPLRRSFSGNFCPDSPSQKLSECCGAEHKNRKTGDMIGYDGQLYYTCW